jgi:diacylglycerol kinase (ATP)
MTVTKQPGPKKSVTGNADARGDFLRDDGESGYKSHGGPARLFNALKYSWQGVSEAFRVESAFRQELLLVAVLVPNLFWLPLTTLERVLLVFVLVQVLVVELLNSSLEAAIDRISLERHKLSGRAKDFGSAAVFLTLALAIGVWAAIGVPALMKALGW